MAIVKFPVNPSDGMLFEPAPGVLYRYNDREHSWVRIDITTVGLATPLKAGLMSKEDYQKLQSILLPPPQSTIKGEDCDVKFKDGLVSIYSTDESIVLESSLPVGGQLMPWQLHENTAGYNFKLNLEQFIEQIESRGKLKKVQFAGPDGQKGSRGAPGRDALDTGPEGEKGDPGLNSNFPGSVFPEATALELDDDQKNRAIVDITTESSETEDYIVVTRANIGNPDACPTTLSPSAFDSPWILVLDQKEANVTRRLEATGDCAITCRICVSQVYYLNIENIIETIEERYEAKLHELKDEKERIIAHWLKVMSALFNEQKYALCCALENCTTRKRNQDTRRYIEQSRIQAAIADQSLVVSSGDDDKITVPSDQRCDLDEDAGSDTDSHVVYGKECEQYLVTMSLNAKVHNRDPRSGVKGRWLTARLAPGDYMAEVLSCCANFGRKIQPRADIPRTPPAPPPIPQAPSVGGVQATQYVPQTPFTLQPPRNAMQYVGQSGNTGGSASNLFVNRPATSSQPQIQSQQTANNAYNRNAGILPVSAPVGGPGGAIPPGLRVPFSFTTTGILTADQIAAKQARGECVLELSNQVGNQPGDLVAKGYTGYIGSDCRIAHGYANSLLVPGCKPICTDTNDTATPVSDNNLRFPNKYTGRVAILHYGLVPTHGTGEEKPVEKVTEFPALGPNGGFFQDLFAARQAYIGLSTIFNHAGGDIKVWIPDPDTISANNDGGIVIGIRSRKCVEDTTSASTTGTTTQLPTIYIYRDILDPKTLVGSIQPFVADIDHLANYGLPGSTSNEGSGSASLTTGPTLDAEVSKAFFVMANDGLGFYHIHHTGTASDSFSTTVFAKYRVESNNQTIDPIVEDDGGSITPTVEPDAQVFTAAWSFTNETSGVVLNKFDPDVHDDWILSIEEANFGDLKRLVASSVDGSELVLSQGSLGGKIPVQSVAEPFILCRALKRACNVPAALNKRYSIGVVNRVKGINFRICRNIPEWSLDSWIRRPFVYAPMPYPCGSNFCNIKHQVIIGSDGQIVPFNDSDDHQVRIDGSKVNIAFVIDQSSSMHYEYDYLSAKIDDLAQYILATDVNTLSMSLVTFGGQDAGGDPVLRQDFTTDIPTIVEAIDMADPLPTPESAYFEMAQPPGLYAIKWTAENISWEPDAVKIIVIITDHDSSTANGMTPEVVTAALKPKKIILNGIVKNINESVGGAPRPFDTLLCESWSYRYAECNGDLTKHISEAWVIDKHSRSSCNKIDGESPARNGRGLAGVFGITGDGKLWVDHGCRATFGIRYREDEANSSIITTQYGRPNDPLNPAGGGVGLCYANGGTLFSIDDLRNVNIEDDNLTPGATQLTDGNWDIQPFGRIRIGSGTGGATSSGGPMPFELTEAVVNGMASPNYILLVGKYEAGFPPNNAPIQGAIVNLRWSNFGDGVVASTITDSNGRYAFQIPKKVFPHNQTSFTTELLMYNLPFLGGTWTISAIQKESEYNQVVAINGANTSTISGNDVTTIPPFEEKWYEFSGDSTTHPEFPVTIGPDPSAPPGVLDGAPSYVRYRFGIRGVYHPRNADYYTDGFTRINKLGVVDGKLAIDLGFDDNTAEGGDYDFNDIVVRMQHNGAVSCLPTENLTPILRASQTTVVNDIWDQNGLNGPTTNNIVSAGVRAFTNAEINTVKKALTCRTHGFLQQFANIKLREIQSFAPKIDADCGAAVFGGPSTVYNRITGIPMTEATLDGTIQSVQATILGLPGTSIRASVYDREGRGIVMRSVSTNPTQTWEVRSWPIDDIDRYINYNANTFDTINQANALSADNQSTSTTYTLTTVKLENATTTSADLVRNLQTGDPRLNTAAGRLNLYTSGLTIKLRDLATVAFEFINPDTGIICYFADVKVAVQRLNSLGVPEIVMVDIANFEPFGTTVQEPGEIPLVIFGGVVESGGGTESQSVGSYATATLTLTSNVTALDEILLGGVHREGSAIHGGSQTLRFVNDFIAPSDPSYPGHQVKIGATPNDTLNNLCDFINGVGVQNGTWHNALIQLGLPVTDWQANSFIECAGVSGETITFKATIVGVEGNALQARTIIDSGGVMQFGSSATFSGGVNPVDGPVLVTTLEMTEDDMSAYLENFWSIALPDTTDNPNICTRFKEMCPDCVVVKCDRTDLNSVLRQEIECIDKAEDMLVPLNKYLFTPIAPCETCMMHYKQVEWYERGWRISACCGAFVEIDGMQWIVVKRSIGVDTTCGGGESENTECIRTFIESGRGHPAIAWPSIDGEEFAGRPHSGFAKFTLDPGLSDQIIAAISNHNYRALRGNLTPGNVAETIPFILFPRLS